MKRRKRSNAPKSIMAEINVVPYIDVMLVLLVIFMIATPMLTQGVQVNLPQATAKPTPQEAKDPMIITVDQYGRYYLNIAAEPSKPIRPDDLVNRVAAELQVDQSLNQTRQVFVKGDKSVDYGKVVGAMVLLQEAGVQGVGLLTKAPENA